MDLALPNKKRIRLGMRLYYVVKLVLDDAGFQILAVHAGNVF
ncbi:MAG: hypothetical protein RIT03_672 [Bacteroidota bacterium]|jgi:hypothetical protein